MLLVLWSLSAAFADPEKQAKRKAALALKKAEKAKQAGPADSDDDAPNPLLPAPRPVKPNATGQALASQWFSNPAFAAFRGSAVDEVRTTESPLRIQ